MKVAFLVDAFPAISETFILDQVTGLLDMGHDIKIFAKVNPRDKKIHADVLNYNIMNRVYYYLTSKRNNSIVKPDINRLSQSLFKLFSIFRDEKFDVIHCHFGPNGIIGVHLKEMGIRAKIVTSFHSYDIILGRKFGAGFYTKLAQNGDCFLAHSQYARENLVKFGISLKKIIMHPCGINMDKFTYREHYNLKSASNIKILTVARLEREKGLIYGIMAISKLGKNNPKLKLRYSIIGQGPLKNTLKKLIKKLNLNKIVCLLGPMQHREVIKEMRRSHLFILPSIQEGLPVSILEALSTGVPVITTSVGGIPEVIHDNKSGFLVPQKNPDALAKKIEYLIKNQELCSKAILNGRKIIEEKYDIRKLNKQLVGIYKSLIH